MTNRTIKALEAAMTDHIDQAEIAGDLVLTYLAENPASPFSADVYRILDDKLTDPDERALFDLPPKPPHN